MCQEMLVYHPRGEGSLAFFCLCRSLLVGERSPSFVMYVLQKPYSLACLCCVCLWAGASQPSRHPAIGKGSAPTKSRGHPFQRCGIQTTIRVHTPGVRGTCVLAAFSFPLRTNPFFFQTEIDLYPMLVQVFILYLVQYMILVRKI